MPINPPVNNPFCDDDCDTMNQVLATLAQADDILARCKNCGLDVDPAIARVAGQRELVTRMKEQFFPNRP